MSKTKVKTPTNDSNDNIEMKSLDIELLSANLTAMCYYLDYLDSRIVLDHFERDEGGSSFYLTQTAIIRAVIDVICHQFDLKREEIVRKENN